MAFSSFSKRSAHSSRVSGVTAFVTFSNSGWLERRRIPSASVTSAGSRPSKVTPKSVIEVRLPVDDRRGDDEIAAAVLERLAWDVTIPHKAMHVTVDDGWVTLSGEVDWHYERENAEQALQRLQGVTGISNHIRIKTPVDAGHVSDDIMHALHRSWFFDPKTIDVRADAGTVFLSGTVHTPHERQVAAATAWAAPGVTDVRNDIVLV